MQVELGNVAATMVEWDGPRVTYVSVPETYTYEVADSAEDLATEVAKHLAQNPGGQTHLPGQEALLAVNATWQAHSSAPPSWVWSDNADFGVLLGRFYGCPVGRPGDVEGTHFTHSGPPGSGPPAAPEEDS
jgi:hypothetical protein